jgi:hypothetical protein
MVRQAIRRLRHSLAHRLGWAQGHVVSAWNGDALWIDHQCATCGRVSGAHIADWRVGKAKPLAAHFIAPTVWHR